MFGKFLHITNMVIFAKVAGAVKTKDEAQTIVDAEVKKAQDAWDADNALDRDWETSNAWLR